MRALGIGVQDEAASAISGGANQVVHRRPVCGAHNERSKTLDTPIFNALRNEHRFMCQACTDRGWPYGWFCCVGDDGLCD